MFKLGDYVTNGTPMKGHIERFEYSFKGDDVYVYTDWSGVGMNLASLKQAIKLPSKHQIGHNVDIKFGIAGTLKRCTITKVHFSYNKILYDVEVSLETSPAVVNQKKSRLYNVEAELCS